MPGFHDQVMWCANMNFSDPISDQFNHPGEFTAGGDLAIGTGVAAPGQEIAVGQIASGGGISVTYSNPNIILTVTGGGLTWSNISASQTLAVLNGYFCSAGGALSLALPAVSAVGDMIEILLCGSTSFTITQTAGQQITLGNLSTTAGVGGSLSTTQQGDAIRLICRTANLLWICGSGSIGNFTIV